MVSRRKSNKHEQKHNNAESERRDYRVSSVIVANSSYMEYTLSLDYMDNGFLKKATKRAAQMTATNIIFSKWFSIFIWSMVCDSNCIQWIAFKARSKRASKPTNELVCEWIFNMDERVPRALWSRNARSRTFGHVCRFFCVCVCQLAVLLVFVND